MTTSNIQLLCQYNPENDQLEIKKSQNFDSLNSDSKYTIEDAVGDIIGAMNEAITELVKDANGSKIFSEGRSFVLEFGYNYAVNLQQAREKYGEEGYRDELSATGKSFASFIVGAAGSEVGKTLGFALSSTLPGKITGAIVGGVVSSELYEKFAQEPVENFFNNLIDTNLTTTPNSISLGYQQQNSDGEFELQKDFYQVQSGDTLSQIAQSLGTTTQILINNNPFLQEPGRVSSDGKYALIKPGEKLSLSSLESTNPNSSSSVVKETFQVEKNLSSLGISNSDFNINQNTFAGYTFIDTSLKFDSSKFSSAGFNSGFSTSISASGSNSNPSSLFAEGVNL
jgi:hypothetical protein